MNINNGITNTPLNQNENKDPLAIYKELLLATGDKKNLAFMNLIGTLKKAKEKNVTS